MRSERMAAAALVLVGHGSTVNADSGAPIYQHAQALRARKLFGCVREGFWKQEPRVTDLVESLAERWVFIVPVFVSEGYFTEQVIPRALGLRAKGQASFERVQPRGGKSLFYTEPVGTHPRLVEAVLARAEEARAKSEIRNPKSESNPQSEIRSPKELALFLAGHGTPKHENSRKAIEQHAAAIRAMKLYAEVRAVFLEEEPRIADWHRLTACAEAVMVPCFISDGMHANEDIPALLGETAGRRAGKRIWVSASVGTHPLVAEVILERVRDCFRAGVRI